MFNIFPNLVLSVSSPLYFSRISLFSVSKSFLKIHEVISSSSPTSVVDFNVVDFGVVVAGEVGLGSPPSPPPLGSTVVGKRAVVVMTRVVNSVVVVGSGVVVV